MLKEAGVSFDSAVLSGGGSRSPHWPQMFADCLGVPITVAETQETGALGAAIGAALAVGETSSYEEGLARMAPMARRTRDGAGPSWPRAMSQKPDIMRIVDWKGY